MPVHPVIAARFPLIRDLEPGTPPEAVPESALGWFAPFGPYEPPAVEVGVGGGARLAVVLRRARAGRR